MKSIIESISHRLSSPSKNRSKKSPLPHDEPPAIKEDGFDDQGYSEDDVPLLNLDLLSIKPADRQWFTDVNTAVREFSNVPDNPKDYRHIRRIVSNAAHILDNEVRHHEWARKLDPLIIWVSCMVHSVSRQLYRAAEKPCDPLDFIDEFLKSCACPLPIRRQVAFIAVRVTVQIQPSDIGHMKAFSLPYPAYRVIQDAHMLGEMGVIGIVQLYRSHALFISKTWDSTEQATKLVEDYLAQYQQAMRTETGKKMAEERSRWVKEEFLRQWNRETDTSNV